MKKLRLIFWLTIMVPAWAVLGAFSTLDSGKPLWFGLTVGSLIGLFFGLGFGGNPNWRFWDYIFGPRASDDRPPDPDNIFTS